MEFLVAQLVNGLVYGMLLFLMAAGLCLIFGLMNVVSLAHGSFFMLGAFFGLSIFEFTGSFWLAFCLAPIPVVIIGVATEMLLLRPLYRRGHMDQVLLTFGLTFVFFDIVQSVWGRTVRSLPAPHALRGTVEIGIGVFSIYRLFLIALGFAIALLLWIFLERSRLGAMVRAGVDDSAMAAGLGANIPALFSAIFGAGVALAALGGVAAGPILGLYPGMDAEILILAFIVIVIGGMGSLRGAFVGSLLIGIADTFGKAYLPSMALFLIYLVMAIVLLVRPQGLFGIPHSPAATAPMVSLSMPRPNYTNTIGLILIAAMIVFPFMVSSYQRELVTEIYIFAIFAMSSRSTAWLHGPHVAWTRRVLWPRGVWRGDPGSAFGHQRVDWCRRRRADCRGRIRGDRVLLRAYDRHLVPHADPRVLATRLRGCFEVARADGRD